MLHSFYQQASQRPVPGGGRQHTTGFRTLASTPVPPVLTRPICCAAGAAGTAVQEDTDNASKRRQVQRQPAKDTEPAEGKAATEEEDAQQVLRRLSLTLADCSPLAAQSVKKPLREVLDTIEEFRGGRKQALSSSDTPPEPSQFGNDVVILCRSFGKAYRQADDKEKKKCREGAAEAARWLRSQVLPLVTAGAKPGVTKYGRPELSCAAIATITAYLPVLSDALLSATGQRGGGLKVAHAIAEHMVQRLQRAADAGTEQQLDIFAWARLLHGLQKAGLVPCNQSSVTDSDEVEEEGGHDTSTSQPAVHPSRLSSDLHTLVELSVQQAPVTLSSQGCDARSLSLLLLMYSRAKCESDLTPLTKALASNWKACSDQADFQALGTILSSLSKLSKLHPCAYNPALFTAVLNHMSDILDAQRARLTPQDIVLPIKGCQLVGHVEGVPRLLATLTQHKAFPKVVRAVDVYGWILLLTAMADMHRQLGGRDIADENVEDVEEEMRRFYVSAEDTDSQDAPAGSETSPDPDSATTTSSGSTTTTTTTTTSPDSSSSSSSTVDWDSSLHQTRQLRLSAKRMLVILTKPLPWLSKLTATQWAAILSATAELSCCYSIARDLTGHLEDAIRRQQKADTAGVQAWYTTVAALGAVYYSVNNTSHLSRNATWSFMRAVGPQLKDALSQATGAQPWVDAVWGASKLHWYDQQLCSSAAKALASLPASEVSPDQLSKAIYAFGGCNHWDANVQELCKRAAAPGVAAAMTHQQLAQCAHGWATLSCTAPAPQDNGTLKQLAAVLFAEAASRPAGGFRQDSVEMWSLCLSNLRAQHLGWAGLPAGPLLEAAQRRAEEVFPHAYEYFQHSIMYVIEPLKSLGYDVERTLQDDGAPSKGTSLKLRSAQGGSGTAGSEAGAYIYLTSVWDRDKILGTPPAKQMEWYNSRNSKGTRGSQGSSDHNAHHTEESDASHIGDAAFVGGWRIINAIARVRAEHHVVFMPESQFEGCKNKQQQREYLRNLLYAQKA